MLNVNYLDFNSNATSVTINGNEEEEVLANFNFNVNQIGRPVLSITFEKIESIDSAVVLQDFENFREQVSEYIKNIDFAQP